MAAWLPLIRVTPISWSQGYAQQAHRASQATQERVGKLFDEKDEAGIE